jgi:hypothetical protein
MKNRLTRTIGTTDKDLKPSRSKPLGDDGPEDELWTPIPIVSTMLWRNGAATSAASVVVGFVIDMVLVLSVTWT